MEPSRPVLSPPPSSPLSSPSTASPGAVHNPDSQQRQQHHQRAKEEAATEEEQHDGLQQRRHPVANRVDKKNFYAQKLNNSGAHLIEIGRYDRAIESLGKALKLTGMLYDDGMIRSGVSSCPCHECTIDSCISYSENTGANHLRDGAKASASSPRLPSNDRMACRHKNKKQKVSSASYSSSSQTTTPLFCGHFFDPEEHNIYCRPIQVSPSSIAQGHKMGSTLFLIITFNLALAHHLSALNERSEEQGRAKLENTLRFYELVDSWQQRNSTDNKSIRFNMIVWNNTSHVHRYMRDHANHKKCLERLLSALMFVVDHEKTIGEQRLQQQQREEEEYAGYNNEAARRGRHRSNPQYHLEEFVHTTTKLILRECCADAA